MASAWPQAPARDIYGHMQSKPAIEHHHKVTWPPARSVPPPRGALLVSGCAAAGGEGDGEGKDGALDAVCAGSGSASGAGSGMTEEQQLEAAIAMSISSSSEGEGDGSGGTASTSNRREESGWMMEGVARVRCTLCRCRRRR